MRSLFVHTFTGESQWCHGVVMSDFVDEVAQSQGLGLWISRTGVICSGSPSAIARTVLNPVRIG